MSTINKNTVAVFCDTLTKLASKNKKIVAVTADVSKNTFAKSFEPKYKNRLINVGIAEQNMIGVAAGLAKTNLIPFASSYASFVSMRSCEQIRTDICYQNLPVKIVTTNGGLSFGIAGSTHHCIEDIAILNSMPNMSIVIPSDSYETEKVIEQSLALNSPLYVRLNRGELKLNHASSDFDFEIGKAMILSKGNDVTLIGYGITVNECLEASKLLKTKDISCEVINNHTIKPLDEKTLIKSLKKTKLVVVAEEANINGSLGDKIASLIATNQIDTKLVKLGITDEFSQVGEANELYDRYNLTASKIYFKVLKEFKK